MQPYTPHGDSNQQDLSRGTDRYDRCNLIPLTGTVTVGAVYVALGQREMQPYTPHGDSNS